MFNLLAVNLQQAFSSIETWVAATFVFLTTTTLGGIIGGIFMRMITKKVNKQTTVSSQQLDKATTLSAEKAVRKMVGKAFNVNIQSEVSKAIQAELKPIRENAGRAALAARNSEIACAHVLLAQSRSSLLNEEEQENLRNIAKKILAQADGEVVSPMTIEISEGVNESRPTEEEVARVETNASLVSFNDVE